MKKFLFLLLFTLLLGSVSGLTIIDVADYPTAENISGTYVPYNGSYFPTDLNNESLTNVNFFEAVTGWFTNLKATIANFTSLYSENIYLNDIDINSTGNIGLTCDDGKIWKFNSTGGIECATDQNTDDQTLAEVLAEGNDGSGYNATVDCITLQDGQTYCTLGTTYYNATSYLANTGTVVGLLSYTQHTNGDYDGVTLNLTERVSAPAMNIEFNFTDGMTDITQGILRYYTSSISGDHPLIQLWDFENSVWESYGEFSETLDFSTIQQSVFDSTEHIENGTVRMRIYKEGNGNINNKYYIDWLAVSKGFGVPAPNEVDPFYMDDKFNLVKYENNTNNLNLSGYNVTADTYKMAENTSYGVWSNETDFIIGYIGGLP